MVQSHRIFKNSFYLAAAVATLVILAAAIFATPTAAQTTTPLPFITTWAVSGTGNDLRITIPTTGGGYNYTVDWGDTDTTTYTGDASHTYTGAGTYMVEITGNTATGGFPQIYINRGDASTKIRSVEQWGSQEWRSMTRAFEGVTNFQIAGDAGNPDLSEVEDMSRMFWAADAFNSDISGWDVSNVTDMSHMFQDANAFNQDISGWKVSNVTDMSDMFGNNWVFNQDLSGWNVSSVTNMAYMFDAAGEFNQDLGGWDVSKVVSMDNMFSFAYPFNQDLGDWDISSATRMEDMFLATALNTANYDATLQGWSTLSSTETRIPNGITLGRVGQDLPSSLVFLVDYSGAAQVARAILTSAPYLWTITDGNLVSGTDISLSGLTLMAGQVQVSLSPSLPNTEYTATALDGVSELTVTPTTTDPGASVTVNGVGADVAVQLTTTGATIKIEVTSQDGSVKQEYKLVIGEGGGNSPPTKDNDIAARTAIAGSPFRFAFPEDIFSDADAGDTLIYSVADSAKPDWLNFDGPTRTFSGTPAATDVAADPVNVTVTATDDRDATVTATETFGVTVEAAKPDAFITDWETATDLKSIIIPTESSVTYNYTVNWGDGTVTPETGNADHDYIAAGEYTVTITGEDFKQIRINDHSTSKTQIRAVRQWGAGREWKSMSYAFRGVTDFEISARDPDDLIDLPNLANLDADGRLDRMFLDAANFTGDGSRIGEWDVSNVRTFRSMFEDAPAFDQDLSDWVFSLLTPSPVVSFMFSGSGLSTDNYDAILNGWSTVNPDTETAVPTGMFLSAAGINYSGTGQLSHELLDRNDIYNWGFNDARLLAGTDISLKGLTLTAGPDNEAVSLDQNLVMDTSKTGNLNLVQGRLPLPTTAEYRGTEPRAEATAYSATVESGVGVVIVTLTTTEDDATLAVSTTTGDDTATPDDDATVTTTTTNNVTVATVTLPTTGSKTIIDIVVTNIEARTPAPDKAHTQAYSLTITRAVAAFITTWSGQNIAIPVASSGETYSYTVDWGDDSDDTTIYTGRATHDYGAGNNGPHTVAITGDFPRIFFKNNDQIRSVTQWGGQTWTSMEEAFMNVTNVTDFEITATDFPILADGASMRSMFEVSSTFDSADIGHWEVGMVTDMSRMFYGAAAFNQDLDWDVSRVENFHSMFANAIVFNGNISAWRFADDADKNINMSEMFHEADAFDQDLSGWNVDNVTNFGGMFYFADIFSGDVSGWTVSKGRNFQQMFIGAEAFNQDLGHWDISSARESGSTGGMIGMFDFSGLQQPNYDLILQGWSTLATEDFAANGTCTPSGITLDAVRYGRKSGRSVIVGVKYSGAAQVARETLDKTCGWTISDGGLLEGTDISLSSLRPSTGQVTLDPATVALPATEYAVTVVSIADEMIVSPSTTDPGATWTVSSPTTGATVTMNAAAVPGALGDDVTAIVSGSTAASATVTLADASSTTDTTTDIIVKVTSADDSDIFQEYTLTVTREQEVDGEPCYSSAAEIDETDAYRAYIPYCAADGDDDDPWNGDGYYAEPRTEDVCVQRYRQGSQGTQETQQVTPGSPANLDDCRFRDDMRLWETPADSTDFAKSTSSTFRVRSAEVGSTGADRRILTVELVLSAPELSYEHAGAVEGYNKSVKVEYVITGFEDEDETIFSGEDAHLLEKSCRIERATCFRVKQPAPSVKTISKVGQFSIEMGSYQSVNSANRGDDIVIIGELPLVTILNADQRAKVTGNDSPIEIKIELRRTYAGHGDHSRDYIPNTAGECDYVEQPWLGCPEGYHDGYDKVMFSVLPVNPPAPSTASAPSAAGPETLEPDTQHASCAGGTPHGDCPTLTLSSDAESFASPGDAITVAFNLARGANGGGNPWKRLTLEAMCDPDFELRDENGVVVAGSVSFHPAQAEERAFDEWRGDCRYVRTGGAIMTPPTRDDASFDMTDRNAGTPGTQVNGPVAWTATLSLPDDFSGEWTLSASIDPREDASGNQFTSLVVANQDLAISEPEPEPEPASVEKVEPDTQHNSCAGDNPHGDCPTLTLPGAAVASPGEEITVTFSLARGENGGNQSWKRLTLETMCDPDYELRDENGTVVASSVSHHLVQTPERAFEDWRGDCQYTRSGDAIMPPPARDASFDDAEDQNPGTPGTQVLGPVAWTATLTLPADFSGAWTLSASIDPREDASGNQFTALAVANQDLAISAPEPEPEPASVEKVEADTQHSSCAGDTPHGDCPTLTLSSDAESFASPGDAITVAFNLARGANGGGNPWKRLTLETMCDPDYELRDENGNVVASSVSHHLVQTPERAFEDWRGDCEYDRTGGAIMTPPARDDSSFDMTDRNPGTPGTQVNGPVAWTAMLTLPEDFSGEWTLSASIDPREDASGNQFTSLAVANQDLEISD